MKYRTKTLIGCAASMALAQFATQAGITGISAPSQLGSSTILNWPTPGLATGSWSLIPNGSYFSGGGFSGTVTQGGGSPMYSTTQAAGDSGFNWNGNFFDGEPVLYNGVSYFGSNPGNIGIHFTAPVSGAGFQVENDWSKFATFMGVISAYGSHNQLLGTYSFNGFAGESDDGTAPFAGFIDTSAEISTITISTDHNDFAIGALYIGLSSDTTGGSTTLTLPDAGSTGLLFGFASIGLLMFRRQK
jgi:hypothetical protein